MSLFKKFLSFFFICFFSLFLTVLSVKVKAATQTETVSVTSFNAVSGDLDEFISYEARKGSAATAPALYSNQIRIYQNGGELHVSAKSNAKIKSIVFQSAMNSVYNYDFDNSKKYERNENVSISANDNVTISNLDVSNIYIYCLGTDTKSRIYLSALSVTYEYYEPEKYTVTFNSNGGTNVSQIENVVEGSQIEKPVDPKKDNCIFLGWYKENTFENQWKFNTDAVTSNTTLYAKWEEVSPLESALDNFKKKDVVTRLSLDYNYEINNSQKQVVAKYSGSTTTNMTGGNDSELLGLNSSLFRVIGNKGGHNNYPGLNKDGDFRLYYHDNGSNTIDVSIEIGTIDSIILKCNKNYENVSVIVNGNAVSSNNDEYEINSNMFTLGNANISGGQVQIKSMTINYTVSKKSNFKLGNTSSLQFGTVIDTDDYEVLSSANAEFGMLYALHGTSFDDYNGNDAKIRKIVCTPAQVATGYQLGVAIRNIQNNLSTEMDAVAYVCVDGVYYKSNNIKTGSVKSVANTYVIEKSNDANVKAHLDVLNFLAD